MCFAHHIGLLITDESMVIQCGAVAVSVDVAAWYLDAVSRPDRC